MKQTPGSDVQSYLLSATQQWNFRKNDYKNSQEGFQKLIKKIGDLSDIKTL